MLTMLVLIGVMSKIDYALFSECDCHIPGVMGGVGVCDTKTGQCICKPLVTSRRCDTCSPGTYNLIENNLFGCSGKNIYHFV